MPGRRRGDKYFEQVLARLVGCTKPAEDKAYLRVVLAKLCYRINPVFGAAGEKDDAVRGCLQIRRRGRKSVFERARSASPIGVNVPMTSMQATAAANPATKLEPLSTAHKAAIALIKTRAFVGAANSQNILETL